VRGKSADDIAKEKREKELLYYTGDLCLAYTLTLLWGDRKVARPAKKTVPIFLKCSLSEIRSEIKGQPAQYCQGLTLS